MPNGTASVAFAHDNKLTASDISMYAHIHMWLGEFFEKDCFSTLLLTLEPTHTATSPHHTLKVLASSQLRAGTDD